MSFLGILLHTIQQCSMVLAVSRKRDFLFEYQDGSILLARQHRHSRCLSPGPTPLPNCRSLTHEPLAGDSMEN